MRNITQTEIDNAPEWATHYTILNFGVLYQNNEYFQSDVDGFKCVQSRVSDEAQPIQRKEFDISEYEYSHGGLKLHSVDDVNGDLYLSHYREVHRRTREDAIAEAKHFKLTAEDLK